MHGKRILNTCVRAASLPSPMHAKCISSNMGANVVRRPNGKPSGQQSQTSFAEISEFHRCLVQCNVSPERFLVKLRSSHMIRTLGRDGTSAQAQLRLCLAFAAERASDKRA